jgi:hypothetical protein
VPTLRRIQIVRLALDFVVSGIVAFDWKVLVDFLERLSNSSFQGAVTPLYKDRRGTKSKTATSRLRNNRSKTTNTRNHSRSLVGL